MAGNELERARISMMARSISSNTRPDTLVRDHRLQAYDFSLATRGGSIHWGQALSDASRGGVNVTCGRVLLYGIGTKAVPSWDPKTRWNNLLGGLAVGRSKRTCELTSSIVPQGTSVHRLVELDFPPIAIGLKWLSCRCCFSGPAELGAVNPNAMQDHRQPACQRDDGSFHATMPGDLHRPRLEPGPSC